MASGRLGSALIGASRTITVYDNTSGFSAAISLLAKMKSSTSNGTISIILDSSSTAPETSSQISTTSFNNEVLKLFYNSTSPASVSSVTGKFEYDTYASSNRGVEITEFPSNTVTSGQIASYAVNPIWLTTDWNDWGVPGNYIGVFRGDSNGSVRFYTQTQIDNAGIAFEKYLINASQTAPSGTYDSATSTSYADYKGAIDPYCNVQPYFHASSNAYMGVVYLHTNGASARNHTRTSNSLVYQYISNSASYDSANFNPLYFASGGIAIFTHRMTQTVYIVCYGRDVSTNARIEQVIENNPTTTGASYPLHYRIATGNTLNSTNNYTVNFFEYNPNTQKSYALMYWDGKRRLLEFDVAGWESKLASDDGSTGNTVQTLDTTISAGLVTDISDNAPDLFLKDNTRRGGPIVRNGKSSWIIPIRSGSTYTIYQTNDFKKYSVYDTTANFSETLDGDTVVISDGTDTDKITSSFDSLDQAGLLEFETSFNDFERTGLVLSNNDRVIVRNNGTENIAVNVMGYEETS